VPVHHHQHRALEGRPGGCARARRWWRASWVDMHARAAQRQGGVRESCFCFWNRAIGCVCVCPCAPACSACFEVAGSSGETGLGCGPICCCMQMRPGDSVLFKKLDLAEAHRRLLVTDAKLAALRCAARDCASSCSSNTLLDSGKRAASTWQARCWLWLLNHAHALLTSNLLELM